jgi:hypothetical protein
LLSKIIEEGFEKKAWHGPNLRGSLRGVSPELAAWRPARDRHNIWEIALHCAYWKYAVRRRLLREKRGSFPLKGSNWFVRPAPGADWRADLALLADQHRRLVALLAMLTPADLNRRTTGTWVDGRTLLSGIAAHDVYHAGQIQQIKRLSRS